MHLNTKSILQWNLNSLKTKFPRLENLILTENVGILALQETKNPTNKPIKIRGYKIFQKDRNARGGGVLIAVHKNIPSTPLIVNTQLEVVACTVFFNNYKLNICNFYLPDHAHVDYDIITNILNSISEPKIILGDFNAKHISWGSPESCPRGILLTDCFLDNNLLILNDGSPTRYDKRLDTYSHIDVTCCSLPLSDKLVWSTNESTHSSDHFPITIKYNLNSQYK